MTSCHATDSAIDVVTATGRNRVFRPSPCLHGHHSVGVPRGSGDMTMETLVEAMARLESSGCTGAFAATPDGHPLSELWPYARPGAGGNR